jgi:hypothetical protein
MSYTTLHLVKEGGIENYREFANSWGGAMFIWDSLCKRYFPGQVPYTLIFGGGTENLWGLAQRKDVALNDRVVLMTTFDRAMVRKENLLDLANRFEQFVKDHPNPSVVCSLPDQAVAMRKIAAEQDCVGVCWTQTSVSGDVWYVGDELGESGLRPYDIAKDKGHFFVYDDLAEDLK